MTAGQFMAAEMAEQPAALRRLVTSFGPTREAIDSLCANRPPGVVLVARGSSDHAAIFGRYLLEWALGMPVVLAAPSLMTRYDRTPEVWDWLTIAISQSGRTPEIVDTLVRLKSAGSRTIGITNDSDSPLAAHADAAVLLDAGAEKAVPATKTVSMSFAALALIADSLTPGGLWQAEDWVAVEAAMAAALEDCAVVDRAAEAIAVQGTSIHLGRGFAYPVALESALKLKESTGRPAEGGSTADFLHGPVAAAAGRPAVCYALPGPTYSDVDSLAGRLAEEGSQIIGVGADLPAAGVRIPTAEGLPEPQSALPLLVRAQQLALAAARLIGLDPDTPAGLNKITRTS